MLTTATECKNMADKANAQKDSFIEREVTDIVSLITVTAKKGEYELRLSRSLDNKVIKRLEELGYKCDTQCTRTNLKFSAVTIISWN